mmetsp:Transcript_22183/g.61749  ORF Transcript_22183/g.61749 Transcript_22183/m.61749 type:complete len:238 (+) Transcript_22183:1630-2343(+)
MDRTGPNTSSWIVLSLGDVCRMMVGPTQLPPASSFFHDLPSSNSLAPCFSASSMYEMIFLYDAPSMTGPIWPGPLPGSSLDAFSTSVSTRASCEPPTNKRTEAAMQRCPAQPAKLTQISAAAPSTSQSGNATKWFLAPPNAVQRLCNALARLETIEATGEDPTNVMALTAGLSMMVSTASFVPCTMLKTPGGNPASSMRSLTRYIVRGTFSLGFTTTVFPAHHFVFTRPNAQMHTNA